MALTFAWLGGGAFVAALAYFLYTYAVSFARPAGQAGSVAVAVLVDILLFVAFAAHHSVFARPRVKRLVVRVVPSALERSLYVWVASLLLILVCAAWQPLPGSIYRQNGWAAALHFACVAAGLVLATLGARMLAPLELAGIQQARGKRRTRAEHLVTAFPYSLVRHPIYLGWVLVVFGVPHMTWSRFLMACLSTAYLAVAIPWEERLLVNEFGEAYDTYRRRVRWRMLPFVY
jgi:methanethiol S-methyltransferase